MLTSRVIISVRHEINDMINYYKDYADMPTTYDLNRMIENTINDTVSSYEASGELDASDAEYTRLTLLAEKANYLKKALT